MNRAGVIGAIGQNSIGRSAALPRCGCGCGGVAVAVAVGIVGKCDRMNRTARCGVDAVRVLWLWGNCPQVRSTAQTPTPPPRHRHRPAPTPPPTVIATAFDHRHQPLPPPHPHRAISLTIHLDSTVCAVNPCHPVRGLDTSSVRVLWNLGVFGAGEYLCLVRCLCDRVWRGGGSGRGDFGGCGYSLTTPL